MKMNYNVQVIVPVLIGLILGIGAGFYEKTEVNTGHESANSTAVLVEIAYLNHGPVRPILADVDSLLSGYGEMVQVIRYDMNSNEGEAFLKEKGITGHTPIVIFINGSMDVKLNDERSVSFYSFPSGAGTIFAADGGWTMDDLKMILNQATAQL